MGVYFISVYFVGVHLTGRVFHECVAHRSVAHGCAPHWACISWACTLRACTSWACTSWACISWAYISPDVYLVGVYLTRCPSQGVHLTGVAFLEAFGFFRLGFWEKAAARLARFSTFISSALPLSLRLAGNNTEDRPTQLF